MKIRSITGIAAVVVALAIIPIPLSSMGGTTLPTREARLGPDHPGATSPKANASGQVVLKLDRPNNKVCYRFDFESFEVRGLYIRRVGSQNDQESKPPFLVLYDEAPREESPLKGCATEQTRDIERRQIRALKRHPKRFYVEAFQYDGKNIAGALKRP